MLTFQFIRVINPLVTIYLPKKNYTLSEVTNVLDKKSSLHLEAALS